MSHQPVSHHSAVGLNNSDQLSPPPYEEVCNSRIEIGFRTDVTSSPSAGTNSRHDQSRISTTARNMERTDQSNAETRTKKSNKCLIFMISGLVIFCYLFTVVFLLRTKNCLLPANEHKAEYERKIKDLNTQQEASEKRVRHLAETCQLEANKKRNLEKKIQNLHTEISKIMGQRDELYVQLTRAGLKPEYDTTVIESNDEKLKRITSSTLQEIIEKFKLSQ